MGEEKKEEEVEKVEDAVVLRKTEDALAHARELLDGYDALYSDPEKRRKVTIPSGTILGSALGNLAIGARTDNPDERLDQTSKGFTTLLEIMFGAMLGYNARMRKGK